jgi:hypothetical protein
MFNKNLTTSNFIFFIINISSDVKCPAIHRRTEVTIAAVLDVIETTVNKVIAKTILILRNIVTSVRKYSLVTYHFEIFISTIWKIHIIKILTPIVNNIPKYLPTIYFVLETGFERIM